MQQELQIAIIQADLAWEDAQKNRVSFSEKMKEIKTPVDLILLPEMFTTGFSMTPKTLAESMTGETVVWMQEMARSKDAAIAGSLIIKEEGRFYNRMLFVHPDGKIDCYDKRHAFTLAGEDKEYATGNSLTIVEYKGWKICPLICYDLRFPVWSRNTSNYDVLLYVASWPKPRINAWNSLLKARAIENMSYCIGVNRVGVDTNGYEYSGNSTAIDFLGNEMTPLSENNETVLFATLKKYKLIELRSKLNFLNDKDTFVIK
jgi:predicted amidohydrolase